MAKKYSQSKGIHNREKRPKFWSVRQPPAALPVPDRMCGKDCQSLVQGEDGPLRAPNSVVPGLFVILVNATPSANTARGSAPAAPLGRCANPSNLR